MDYLSASMYPNSYFEIENLRHAPLNVHGEKTTFQKLTESQLLPESVAEGLSFLPVEYLKKESEIWFRGKVVDKFFYSSGTTESARTKSLFSKSGLECYRRSALIGFIDFLKSNQIPITSIVSLIPPTNEWTDSSLAQMIAWFSEFFPTKWIHPNQFVESCQKAEAGTLYIGTAFHWINLLDQRLGCHLPSGCFLMETGGTKGKSRELNREDFYGLLKSELNLLDDQIISEYGMSEMSSQAWAVGGHLSTYSFPHWVLPQVTKGLGKLEDSGQGSLVLLDPTRIDFPYQFRLQDMVELKGNNFSLLGRVPHAVLRGCSLHAEQPLPFIDDKIVQSTSAENKSSWAQIKKCLESLIVDQTLARTLESEFFSREIARWAMEDFSNSIPRSEADFQQAINASQIDCKDILIIPPSTHSFSIIHPLMIALGYGATVSIRIPHQYSSPDSSLNQIIHHFSEVFSKSIFKISNEKLIKGHANQLMVFFGSDDTFETIKSSYVGKIAAFKSALAITLIEDLQFLNLALKDCFSMAGKGCMSSRAIFLVNRDILELQQELTKIDSELPKLNLGLKEICALDHEETALKSNKIPFGKRTELNQVLFTYPQVHQLTFPQRLFVLPCLSINSSNLKEFVNKLGNSLFVSSDFPLPNLPSGIVHRSLGRLNETPMDGFHQGRPLFQPIN